MLLDGKLNRLRRNRLAPRDGQTQRVLHRVLAVAGRQLQDLQVFADALARAVITAKAIVGDAKVAGREHIFPILVVFERAGLANQRIDHVTIIDRVLLAARQAWHPLNFAARVPDHDEVGVDHNVHPVADQPAMNRIRVAFDLDRAATADFNARDALPVIEFARRQLAKARLFLGEFGGSRQVTLVGQPLQKPFILCAVGKVATATQQQGLVDDRLEMPMRRFDIAVFVCLADVDSLRLDFVVIHQVAVT